MSNQKTEYAPTRQPLPGDNETRSLPEGWIRQFDSNSSAWFHVDTLASPPRSIWVHPYDDPQYLESHPNVRDYDSLPEHQESPSPIPISTRPGHRESKDKGNAPEKRGLLGKLKDTVIGTKEEREVARRFREEKQRHGASIRPHSSRQRVGGGGMGAGLGGGLLLGNMTGGSGGDSGGGGNFGGGGDFGGTGNFGGGGDYGGGGNFGGGGDCGSGSNFGGGGDCGGGSNFGGGGDCGGGSNFGGGGDCGGGGNFGGGF